MSTIYRFVDPVLYEKVLVAAKELGYGIEDSMDGQDGKHHVLIDSENNYLHIDTESGSDTSFSRYGMNTVCDMIEALSEKLGVEIIDEHDERFFVNEEDEDDITRQ